MSHWYRNTIKLMESAYMDSTSTAYWNHNGKYTQQIEELRNKLVPASGMCDTLAGEVLRCASKIYYRHFNDGDRYTDDSYRWLKRNIGGFDSYDDMIDKAYEFAAQPQYQEQENHHDSIRDLVTLQDDFDDDDDDDDFYSNRHDDDKDED